MPTDEAWQAGGSTAGATQLQLLLWYAIDASPIHCSLQGPGRYSQAGPFFFP